MENVKMNNEEMEVKFELTDNQKRMMELDSKIGEALERVGSFENFTKEDELVRAELSFIANTGSPAHHTEHGMVYFKTTESDGEITVTMLKILDDENDEEQEINSGTATLEESGNEVHFRNLIAFCRALGVDTPPTVQKWI